MLFKLNEKVLVLILLIGYEPSRAKTVEYKKIENNLIATNGSTAMTLTGVMREVFQEIADFLHILTLKIAQLPEGTEDHFGNLTKNFIDAVEHLGGKVLAASDSFLKDLFRSLRNQLEQVKNEFLDLAENMDKQFDWALSHLNKSLINHSESIDLWTSNIKHELRSFNDTRSYQNGCEVLDNFLQRSTNELKNCCNITIKPVRSLCNRARIVLAKALTVLADSMDRIQKCLDDKNSYLEYMLPCIHVAYDEISAIIGQAVQLRKQFTAMLPVKILYSDWCFVVVLENMEQRKNEIATKFFPNEFSNKILT